MLVFTRRVIHSKDQNMTESRWLPQQRRFEWAVSVVALLSLSCFPSFPISSQLTVTSTVRYSHNGIILDDLLNHCLDLVPRDSSL